MKKLLIILPLLWIMVSCAKKAQPTPGVPSCRIMSANDSTGKPTEYVKYDASGNIIEIDFVSPDVGSLNFVYNDNNRITQCSKENYLVRCKYNNSNRLDTILSYYDQTDNYKVILKYDEDSHIASKTTYRNYGDGFVFQDSCIYSLYKNDRPQQMERMIKNEEGVREVVELYEYEYDSQMNRTKVYLTYPQVAKRFLSEVKTFDLNIDVSSVVKYDALRLPLDHISGEAFYLAGAPIDKNMMISYKSYDSNGKLNHNITISDIKTIYGNVLKTAKIQSTLSSDTEGYYDHLNYTYSCE